MIIILNATKDTYVTNLKSRYNDGKLANVGKSATLDLFKMYNENKYAYSWVAFEFTTLTNNELLALTDADKNTVTFQFDTSVETVDGSLNGGNNVITGLQNANVSGQAARIAAAINAVNTNNGNGLTLNITASSNADNILLLKQNKKGKDGDTSFVLPGSGGISRVGNTQTSSFSRIDYSALLIKFDLPFVKDNFIENHASSVFNNKSNFKAEIILKDVSTGLQKPQNYTLNAKVLLKDFDEGAGRDTIHFSERGFANFVNLNKDNTWELSEFVSKSTDVASNYSFNSSLVENGNEDIKIDVTDYVFDQLGLESLTDKGFSICFSESYLYDKLTYFAKRLGSKHLQNKSLRPYLQLSVNDSMFQIPKNAETKKRFLNNTEDIYLFNRIEGKLSSIMLPTSDVNNNSTIKFRISNNSKYFTPKSSQAVTTFSGKTLQGIKKASISSNDLDRYNTDISSNIKNGKISLEGIWYFEETDVIGLNDIGNVDIVKDNEYLINTLNDTDFTLVGAESNTQGVIFKATKSFSSLSDTAAAIGLNPGNLKRIYEIAKETLEFNTSESTKQSHYRNIIPAIRIEDNMLFGDNSVYTIEVLFVDTKRQYDYVKVPYNIYSENIGDVFYQIEDKEKNEVLVPFEESKNGTKMFFDGEKYIFDLFVPTLFKDKTISFKFRYKDEFSNNNKITKRKNFKIRIK